MPDNEMFNRYRNKKIYKSVTNHLPEHFLLVMNQEEALRAMDEIVICASDYKTSAKALKSLLTPKGIATYRQTFAQFKYRQQNDFVNLKLKKETYNKIKQLSYKFDGINDLLFEYFFDNTTYIEHDELDKMPSALSEEDKAKLILEKLPYSVKELIESQNEKFKQKMFILGFNERDKLKKTRSKTAKELSLKLALMNNNLPTDF
jgi:hypothetical protein